MANNSTPEPGILICEVIDSLQASIEGINQGGYDAADIPDLVARLEASMEDLTTVRKALYPTLPLSEDAPVLTGTAHNDWPKDWTNYVNVYGEEYAMHARTGYEAGVEAGRLQAQRHLRLILGVDQPTWTEHVMWNVPMPLADPIPHPTGD